MSSDEILDNFCNQLDPARTTPRTPDGLPYLYCGWFHSAYFDDCRTLVVRIRKDAELKFKLPEFPEIYHGYNVKVERL